MRRTHQVTAPSPPPPPPPPPKSATTRPSTISVVRKYCGGSLRGARGGESLAGEVQTRSRTATSHLYIRTAEDKRSHSEANTAHLSHVKAWFKWLAEKTGCCSIGVKLDLPKVGRACPKQSLGQRSDTIMAQPDLKTTRGMRPCIL